MSEIQQPVQNAPAAVPTTHQAIPVTATASDAAVDPIRSQGTSELTPESRPELGSGVTDGTTAAAPSGPNLTNVPKEEKLGNGEVLIESHSINEGVLNYKGPGLMGLLKFSKKYFWFSDAPLEHKHLSAYLGNEKSKDIAHPNAAHAQQTGKGLLFFAKRAEDKDHPQGILNMADVSDLAKGNFNDFGFTLHGHKHQFQAVTKAEKDGWIVAIETKAADAKTSREGVVNSSGYKSALEKYGLPAAATTAGTSRSLSRPGKKASKSRERMATGTKTDITTAAVTDTNTTTPAGTTNERKTDGVLEHNPKAHKSEKAAEAAAVGGVAGAAATRSGSTSDEDKKTKKSRSQSRNKRGSLFGNFLAKKEDHDVKKDIKKEEKEEKKEEKAEDKAINKDIKKEDKIEKKEEKAELKAEKKEEKAELKAEKKEMKAEAKEEKKMEKEGDPMSTGQTAGFNAHAVAARVVGEPIVPADGKTTGSNSIPSTAGTGTATGESTAAETIPTSTTRESAPKPNKRASLFGGFFGKREATAPGVAETSPAVPAKDEPSTVSPSAPRLDNPVTEPATETTATESPLATTSPTTPGTGTTPTDKRRSSFFNNLGTKKERKTGTTSGEEVIDGEGRKAGGFGGLLRKASRAQKGSSVGKDPADVPLPKETSPAAANTESAVNEGPAVSEGEAAPNAGTGSLQNTAVSAAA